MKYHRDKLHLHTDSVQDDGDRREAESLRETLRRGELPPADSLSPDNIVRLIEGEQPQRRSSSAWRRKWPLALTACAAGLLLLLVPSALSLLCPGSASGNTAGSGSDHPFSIQQNGCGQTSERMEAGAVAEGEAAESDCKNFDSVSAPLYADPSVSQNRTENTVPGTVQLIPAVQTETLLESGALLVDVRQPEEYKAGHIPEAVNLPLDTLTSNITAYADTARPLIVYCRTGVRSHTAAQQLADIGYTVYDLGGIETDWPYATQTGSQD